MAKCVFKSAKAAEAGYTEVDIDMISSLQKDLHSMKNICTGGYAKAL